MKSLKEISYLSYKMKNIGITLYVGDRFSCGENIFLVTNIIGNKIFYKNEGDGNTYTQGDIVVWSTAIRKL